MPPAAKLEFSLYIIDKNVNTHNKTEMWSHLVKNEHRKVSNKFYITSKKDTTEIRMHRVVHFTLF